MFDAYCLRAKAEGYEETGRYCEDPNWSFTEYLKLYNDPNVTQCEARAKARHQSTVAVETKDV